MQETEVPSSQSGCRNRITATALNQSGTSQGAKGQINSFSRHPQPTGKEGYEWQLDRQLQTHPVTQEITL